MGAVLPLAESVSIGEIAGEVGIPARQAHALLRHIVRRGQAQAIAKWLLDEAQRLANEQARRRSAADE